MCLGELRAKVIDVESGNVTHEIMEGDILKVIKGKKKKVNYDLSMVSINKDEPFIKVFTKPLFELSKSLNGTESQFINYIIQYIRYNTGILAYSNGKPVTRSALARETGLSKSTVDRVINGLVDKEVLGKHKTGRFYTLTVNPFIFLKGYKINMTLYELFCNTKWAEMYEKKNEK